VPDLTDAGSGGQAGLHRRLERRAAGDAARVPAPDERIDRDLLISELARCVSTKSNSARRAGIRSAMSTSWRRYLPAPGPRLRAASGPPGKRRLTVGTAAGGPHRRQRPARPNQRSARLEAAPGDGSPAAARDRLSRDDALAQAAAAASDPAVAALQPRLEKAAATARKALAGFTRYLKSDLRRRSHGEGASGAIFSPGSSATPSAAT